MNYTKIINELSRNHTVFKELLSNITEEIYLWRPDAGKWCLLEILCHLHDEEREDFRARTKHVLETPDSLLPSIDPQSWIIERKYSEQNFYEVLNKFLSEREQSIEWLLNLTNPHWDNAYAHPKFGKMTAKIFLSNWLAHDYLHIRQIIKLKYDFLKQLSNEDLNYAGNW